MKHQQLLLAFLTFLLTHSFAISQTVTEVELRTDGIVIPRIDTGSVTLPSRGQLVYQDIDNALYYYDGTKWSAAGGRSSELSDADADTWVKVEEYPDADQILFTVDSSEYGRLMKNDDGVIVLNLSNDGSQASHLVIGRNAGLNIDTAGFCCNTLIGDEAGRDLTLGATNVMLGTGAGRNTTTGGANTFIGTDAGESNQKANNIVAIGQSAGFGVKQGINSVFIGNETAAQLDSSYYNTFIGAEAGNAIRHGDYNVLIGSQAGANSDTISNTIAIGHSAGLNNKGDYNILIGSEVGIDMTSGGNIVMGHNSGTNAGGGSIIIGNSSGYEVKGHSNTFLGNVVGRSTNNANANTFLGHFSGNLNQTGNDNTYVGKSAGFGIRGSRNIMIGRSSGGFNEVFIDSTILIGSFSPSGSAPPLQSNRLIIHNQSDSLALVYGEFDTDHVGINWDLAISVPNTLSVNGDASKTTAGDWVANSDQRLKKNISYLQSEDMLSKLLNMKGVSYEWNDDQTGFDRPDGIQFGFIAQDLQKVWPENVQADKQGFLQTAYGTYDHMYVEAIKALKAEIDQLKQENTIMRDLNDELRSDIGYIKKLIHSISSEHSNLEKERNSEE